MEIENGEEYTDMHRGFLQACANLGSMDINKAKAVFQELWLKGSKKMLLVWFISPL